MPHPAAAVGSWGEWRLWVDGINLTEHDLTLAYWSDGAARARHLVFRAAPPLAGQRCGRPYYMRSTSPARSGGHAMPVRLYISVASTQMDDSEVFSPWQDWAARHGLRWAAEGGLVPDVFLRRLGDDIEVSWGDRWQPGGEAADYIIEPGVAHCDVADVAAALDGVLTQMVKEPRWRGHAWHQQFRRQVAVRPQGSKSDKPLAWYLDGREQPGRLTNLLRQGMQRYGAKGWRLLNPSFAAHAMTRLSPTAAMFGALSPRISRP